ncbi:uncharacterized protein [Epargyreus clarus]|uniref:uncharacterized protein n=1 Tax=Epargyreus clarus TaxID=520877 RepID=UPI003C2FCEB4
MLREILLFLFICSITCEKESKLKDLQDNNRMVGIDTVHDVKIDKDTIISRNMKLEKRNSGKKSGDHQESEPDWHYSSFPKEVSAHVEQFKQNMSECLKEVQNNEKKSVQRLSPRKESPVHGECLIACVLKRNGVIRNGKIHKENLLALVNKFYAKDVVLMKKLEKQVDRCVGSSSRGGDDCALAARLNECTNALMANNKHTIVVNY